MLLSESLLEGSVELTKEFVAPILSSRRGDRKETLKIDGAMFVDVIAMQILLPMLVSVTSTVISAKLIDKNKPLEELTKELRTLIGKTIAPVDSQKKEELTGIVEESIGTFGASREQARELVELIVNKIESREDKSEVRRTARHEPYAIPSYEHLQ